MDRPLDLSNLPQFLDHLDERDPGAAGFARRLLDEGGTVRVFWGPQQMDVWDLRIQRGDVVVRFGVERGFSDGVHFHLAGASGDWDGLRSLRFAVLAWVRAHAIPLPLDDLDVDLPKHGLATVDWLNEEHAAQAERVGNAWREHRRLRSELQSRTQGQPGEAELRALNAAGLAALEEAAAPRHVPPPPNA